MILVVLYSEGQQCSLEATVISSRAKYTNQNYVATLSRIGQVIILYG